MHVLAVVSNSLQPHVLQHTRLPCPSLSPGVCSNSCPLNQWCYIIISFSAVTFSFLLFMLIMLLYLSITPQDLRQVSFEVPLCSKTLAYCNLCLKINLTFMLIVGLSHLQFSHQLSIQLPYSPKLLHLIHHCTLLFVLAKRFQVIPLLTNPRLLGQFKPSPKTSLQPTTQTSFHSFLTIVHIEFFLHFNFRKIKSQNIQRKIW